jgi:NADH-quinone oxidoreductase subunit M
MDHSDLLLLLLFLPAVAAVVVALLGPRRAEAIRWVSLAAALVSLGLATAVAVEFARLRRVEPVPAAFQRTFHPELVTKFDLLQLPGVFEDAGPNPKRPAAVRFYIGLDGLNVWLIVLTAVLFLPSVLVSWTAIQERVPEFYAWLLLLQTTLIGIFLAFDIVLFYAFFELSLVPLFFLIGIWGGPQRQHAARKFFIYTLTGSVITLLGVLGIIVACYTKTGGLSFSIPDLVETVHQQLRLPDPHSYWYGVQFWVFLALMAGFAVKVPLFPFHTWLPLAHVEAPTAGSVDLAGILLKIGAYGFLRLCLPLAPDVSLSLGLPLVSTLAAIGIVYGAFTAYAQDDVKRLIAYSSVSHVGLCMAGMFALNAAGISGSILQMINHGLSTGALFLLIGMLYERYHTRKLADYSGMAKRLPVLAFFMVFICLSSAGLPLLNGFVGEVLCFLGIFEQEWSFGERAVYGLVAISGVVLGAWYLFTMLRGVFFGPLKEPQLPLHEEHESVSDLSFREVALVAPIAVLCVVIGFFPQPILNASQRDIDVIVDIAQHARDRAKASE